MKVKLLSKQIFRPLNLYDNTRNLVFSGSTLNRDNQIHISILMLGDQLEVSGATPAYPITV